MADAWSVVANVSEDGGGQVTKVTEKKESEDRKEFSYPSSLVRGVPYPLMVSSKRWEDLNTAVKYRSGDIIIATYPKCGTTWSEQVVLLILNGGDPENLNTVTKNTYDPKSKKAGKLWLEACLNQDPSVGEKMAEGLRVTTDEFAAVEGRRVIKTHAPLQLLLGCDEKGVSGLPDGVKVVAVSRNPFDAAVSCYYHAFNPFKSGWPFDAWASVWLSGNVVHGSWFKWTKDWYEEVGTHGDRALFVQFESLKLHARAEVERLATFLGIDYDAALIDRVLEHSTFDSMKQQAEAKGGDKMGHLRKGEVGDWKNHFSPALVNDYRGRLREEFGGSELEGMFDYSEK